MYNLSSSSISSQKSAGRDGRKEADQAWDHSKLRTKFGTLAWNSAGADPSGEKVSIGMYPQIAADILWLSFAFYGSCHL